MCGREREVSGIAKLMSLCHGITLVILAGSSIRQKLTNLGSSRRVVTELAKLHRELHCCPSAAPRPVMQAAMNYLRNQCSSTC